MRNRKKKKKYSRPQTFVGMLLWAWWPIGIAAVIVVWVCSMLVISYQTSEYQSEFYQFFADGAVDSYDAFCENYDVNEVVSYTTSEDQYNVRNKFRLCVNAENGFASTIYQNKGSGNEPVMDSTKCAFIVLRQQRHENTYIFTCDPNMIDEKAWEYVDCTNEDPLMQFSAYRIVLHDVYIMGEQFIPGSYDVVYYGESEIPTEGTVLESFQCDIEVPAGFEQVNLTDGTWTTSMGPLRIGTDTGAETLAYLTENKEEVFGPGTCVMVDDFMGITKSVMCTPVIIGAAEDNASVVSAFILNPWKMYGVCYFLSTIIVLLISVGMAALIASKNYREYHLRVKMEQYRRKTTNALAHDLKSPLMVISGYAENLKENVHAEKREYYADSIMKTTAYMNSIISNLFELDKVEDPEYHLKTEKIDYKVETESILREYEMQIAEKGISCSVEGECRGEVDLFLMKRVLYNIIGNAVKYTPENGTIEIVMKENFYQIRNTGSITEETLKQVYEPFVKGNQNRTGENGSGLGLSIVKNILELHGITYKLETKNSQVIFTMQL